MKNQSCNGGLLSLALLLNRLSLGVLFFFAGVRKMIPDEGQSVGAKLQGFASFVASKAPLPEALGTAYGYALPFVEAITGLLLAAGLFSRISSGVISLMLLSFMIAFGIAWWPSEGGVYDKNVILFTLALLLTVTGAGSFSLDNLLCKKCRVSVEIK